jgi:replicative DNA helicase
LGLLLIDNQIINKVRGYLSVDDFFDLKNAAIYQAILNIAAEGLDIDIPLVIREIEQHHAFSKTNESKIGFIYFRIIGMIKTKYIGYKNTKKGFKKFGMAI